MKNLNKILIATFALVGFAANSNAQSTATATATAEIVAPISITRDAHMNFGNIAVNSTTAGTVVLPTSGSRTKTGGVTLPAVTGSFAPAAFTISGQGNYTYDLTLPTADVTLTHTNTTDVMTATNFVSNAGTTPALASGTFSLKVGATLNVAAAQPAGTYTSTSFNVTVNYN